MGLLLERLLYLQEHYKTPYLSCGLMFLSPVPALPWSLAAHVMTPVFAVAELPGQLSFSFQGRIFFAL